MSGESPHGRDEPGYATPADIPRAFDRFDTPVAILGAGAPGKVGLLELEFAPGESVTRMTHHYYRPPLQIFQPIYHDATWPEMAYIFVVQTGGGMLQGDRYRIDVTCRRGAAAHITTQAASRLYKCEENFITQIVNLTAEADSVLEYLPDATIPYRNTRFYQRLALHIDPSATVIVGEILTPGRTAYGEHHDYEVYASRLEAHDPGGRLLAADTITLQPADSAPNGPALLGPYDVFGTLYVFSQSRPLEMLTDCLRGALAADATSGGRQKAISGVSELPNASGVSVRLLGTSLSAVARARTVAWNAARMALFGRPAPNLRKT